MRYRHRRRVSGGRWTGSGALSQVVVTSGHIAPGADRSCSYGRMARHDKIVGFRVLCSETHMLVR